MFVFVRLSKPAVVSRTLRPAGWRGRVTRPEYDQLVAQGVLATEPVTRSPTRSRRPPPEDPHGAARVPPAAARTVPYFDEDDQRRARPRFDEDDAQLDRRQTQEG
jgi:hypothetical protein